MAKALDIIIDADGEDDVLNGDDRIGDATRQHTRLLVLCEKAENKMEPISGVGIASWVLDEQDGQDLKKEIQGELEGDGQRIESLIVRSVDNITVAGTYGN